MNYGEYLAAGNAATLPVRDDARRGQLHACPVCGVYVAAGRLASLAGLPATFAGGAAWACDGCWSDWHRRQVPFDEADDFVTGEEWFQAFVARTGRDAGNRDAFLGKAYARELDRLDAALSTLAPDAPARADLEARRAKVVARGAFPGSWNKAAIAADGVDVAVLTGAPAGTVVELDGTAYPVDDGSFELSASTPGAYRVQVRHPRHIWESKTINAD